MSRPNNQNYSDFTQCRWRKNSLLHQVTNGINIPKVFPDVPNEQSWFNNNIEVDTEIMAGLKKQSATTTTDLFKQKFKQYEDAVKIYTAAAGTKEKKGIAVVIPQQYELLLKLPTEYSITSAKILATEQAFRFIEESDKSEFVIFSESIEALKAISKNSMKNLLISRITHKVNDLLSKSQKVVHFVWCPEHAEGIKLAGQAAKKATRLDSTAEMPILHTDLQKAWKNSISAQWEAHWKKTPSKLSRYRSSSSVSSPANKFDRKNQVILTRLRIGHTNLTHVHLMKKEAQPRCNCGNLLSVDHILFECSNYDNLRNSLNWPSANKDILCDIKNCKKVLTFLKNANLYDKI